MDNSDDDEQDTTQQIEVTPTVVEIAEEDSNLEERQQQTQPITCKNPYIADDTSSYNASFTTLASETISTNGCTVTITGNDYQFDVSITFEGSGYMISKEEELPTITAVDTPNLATSFLDEYSLKKVVRLSNYYDVKTFDYTSYHEEGAENCTQWQGIDPVFACGVTGILLKEDIDINASCTVENPTMVEMCDDLIATLSVTK